MFHPSIQVHISAGFALQVLSNRTDLFQYKSKAKIPNPDGVQDQAYNIILEQITGTTSLMLKLLFLCCIRSTPSEVLLCLKQENQGQGLIVYTHTY